MNKINRINLEILVQILIELFLSALILVGLQNGRLNLFVHPKFNTILAISAVILIAIAVFSVSKLFKPRHMNNLCRYFIVIIPLMMVFYMSKDLVVAMLSTSQSSSVIKTESKAGSTSVSSGINRTEKIKRTVYKKERGKDYIDITDVKYMKWYYDSILDWKKYKGTKFRLLCCVLDDKQNNGDFAVIGRMGMLCCMADLQTCGFIYEDKDMHNLKRGQWYIVEGEIKENNYREYNYERLPIIFNVKFTKADEPKDKFVYIQ